MLINVRSRDEGKCNPVKAVNDIIDNDNQTKGTKNARYVKIKA